MNFILDILRIYWCEDAIRLIFPIICILYLSIRLLEIIDTNSTYYESEQNLLNVNIAEACF